MRVILWISLGIFPALIYSSDWANVGWKVSGLLEGIFNSIQDDGKVEPGATNLPILFRKAGGIAKFMGVVGPTFALLTVFLPGDHQFEEIMAQFEIINQELGKLGHAMENLEEQLKYESAKTQIHKEFNTMETAVDLFATYSNISNSEIARNTSRDSLVKMETELMLAISSVLKGQNGENEFKSTNLFKSIYETTNGDLNYLAMVSDTIHGTVVNAILAYHSVIYIKYSEEGEDDDMCEQRAQEACHHFDEDMKKMQILMADHLELCEKDGSLNVKKEIDDIVDNYGHLSYDVLATKIKSQLELKYYWLDFVVIVYPVRNPRDYVHTGHKYYRKYKDNEIVVMFKEVSVPSKFVETKWLYDKIIGSFGCWRWTRPKKHTYTCERYIYTSSRDILQVLQKQLRNEGISDFGISVVQTEWRKGKIGPVAWKHSNIGSSVYTIPGYRDKFDHASRYRFYVTIALQNTHIGSSYCPSSHPYLYNYGGNCCKEASESQSENSRPPCNNGTISYTSRCCENSVKCKGWVGCRNGKLSVNGMVNGKEIETSCFAEQWKCQWECKYKKCEFPIICTVGLCDWVPTCVKENKPCQFPFNYKGIDFTGCSTMDNSGVPWCATMTENGKYVDGEWGYCSESCIQSSEVSLDKIVKDDPRRFTKKEDCLKLWNYCTK